MSTHEEHARNWAQTLTADLDAALELYSDEFTFEDRADADHMTDTAITKDELRPRIAAYSNKDAANGVGTHSFAVREAFPLAGANGKRAVVTLWTWSAEGLESYHGLPVDGRKLSTIGITWHQLDAAGRIEREQTYWNDTPVFAELGVPVDTQHYWEAGFGA